MMASILHSGIHRAQVRDHLPRDLSASNPNTSHLEGTRPESPCEVLLESYEDDTSNMFLNTQESLRVNVVNTSGPCPKASESAAMIMLREQLQHNLLGMEQIILFDLWSMDRNTIEAALKKLSDLCNDKKSGDATNNRAAFQLVNGCAIILEVMRQWRHDRKIQSLCCLVILNTTGGEDPRYRPQVEIVDAVVLAMKMHPTFFPVQLCGCGALAGLCQSKTNVDHLVRNCQGIETIVAAMQRYANTKKLHVWARWCLQNILKWEDFRKPLLDVWVRVVLDDALFEIERGSLRDERSSKLSMGLSLSP